MQIFYLVIMSIYIIFIVYVFFTFYIIWYVVSLKLVFQRSNKYPTLFSARFFSIWSFSELNFLCSWSCFDMKYKVYLNYKLLFQVADQFQQHLLNNSSPTHCFSVTTLSYLIFTCDLIYF